MRILDGDLVAANTEIVASITDENIYLPLDRPEVFDIKIQQPDGQELSIDAGTSTFSYEFQPGVNKARLRFQPLLPQNGTYKLIVKGSDISGNLAGKLLYEINFEVILEQQLSYFLPYPNLFSTQTQFVYTLTGLTDEVSAYIQILTISGRVVRHIDEVELGSLSVGTHRTEFVWDGRDDNGDQLANGVYLYRVVARNDTSKEAIKHYESEQDTFFTNGIGKIVILR
ncbi:MAG: FlgD immunoglobulin-like domain containing protein [Saprospiraceae bacterium]